MVKLTSNITEVCPSMALKKIFSMLTITQIQLVRIELLNEQIAFSFSEAYEDGLLPLND